MTVTQNPKAGDRSVFDAAAFPERHANDVDSDPAAIHHTLGSGANQAAPGDHIHEGGAGFKWALFTNGDYVEIANTENLRLPLNIVLSNEDDIATWGTVDGNVWMILNEAAWYKVRVVFDVYVDAGGDPFTSVGVVQFNVNSNGYISWVPGYNLRIIPGDRSDVDFRFEMSWTDFYYPPAGDYTGLFRVEVNNQSGFTVGVYVQEVLIEQLPGGTDPRA